MENRLEIGPLSVTGLFGIGHGMGSRSNLSTIEEVSYLGHPGDHGE